MDKATSALQGSSYRYRWYDGVLPDPTYDQVVYDRRRCGGKGAGQ